MSTQSAVVPKDNSTLTNQPAPAPVMYVLYYRQGNNPHPQQKYFYLPERDMKRVVERVKRHCEVMNYRFVNVRPFLSDLAREENCLLSKDEES